MYPYSRQLNADDDVTSLSVIDEHNYYTVETQNKVYCQSTYDAPIHFRPLPTPPYQSSGPALNNCSLDPIRRKKSPETRGPSQAEVMELWETLRSTNLDPLKETMRKKCRNSDSIPSKPETRNRTENNVIQSPLISPRPCLKKVKHRVCSCVWFLLIISILMNICCMFLIVSNLYYPDSLDRILGETRQQYNNRHMEKELENLNKFVKKICNMQYVISYITRGNITCVY